MSKGKIFLIGKADNVCAGHGNFHEEIAIRPLGAYGEEGFPPAFLSREKAEAWMSDNRDMLLGKYLIVEGEIVL